MLVRLAWLVVAGFALAACQGTGADMLDDVATGPRQAEEVIGSGGVTVAMLLPRSAGGEAGRRARDIRAGAALALADLGDGRLSLAIHDTAGRADAIAALAGQAQAAGARLILGPVTASEVAALVGAGQRPPAIAFTGNGEPRGETAFAIASDAVDSALESVRIAAGAGRKSFVALAPGDFSPADRDRLARGLAETGAEFLGLVPYAGAGQALAAGIAARRETLVKADGVIIFGSGDAPASIAAALRAASSLRPGATIIGNLTWTSASFARPELDGALVSMPDQSGMALIADRYRTQAGRALSLDAAYGYDAVAVAAGIVRTMGDDALTAATLTRSSGFRGTTGIFRFMPDGSVQRPLALYRVGAGTLQLVDAAPEGF